MKVAARFGGWQTPVGRHTVCETVASSEEEEQSMRTAVRQLLLLGSIYALVSCRAQERARVVALNDALKPLSQIEITTGSRINVGPDAVQYLKKYEAL